MRKLARVLRVPRHVTDGNLLRAQVTAAGVALHAQLRADEAGLKAKASGDVLQRLLDAIEKERRKAAAAELAKAGACRRERLEGPLMTLRRASVGGWRRPERRSNRRRRRS